MRRTHRQEREDYSLKKREEDYRPEEGSEAARLSVSQEQVLKPTRQGTPSQDDQSINPAAAAAMLVRTDGDTAVGAAAGRPAQMVQLGAAAYLLSPHAEGELAMAEAMGLLQPGSAAPPEAPLGDAAEELNKAAIFTTSKETLVEEEGGRPLTAVDILNLSRKSTDEVLLADELALEQAKQENRRNPADTMQRAGQPGLGESPASAVTLALAGSGEKGTPLEKGSGEGRQEAAKVFQPMVEGAGQTTSTSPQTTRADAQGMFSTERGGDESRQLIERVVEQARWLIRGNRSEVTIKLKPEHLGDMKLKVTQTDKTLNVEMVVDNQSVKQLVESQLDELQARLQQENPGTEEFNFNVDVHQGNDSDQSEHFTFRDPGESYQGKSDAVEKARTELLQRTERPRWGDSGVGVYA